MRLSKPLDWRMRPMSEAGAGTEPETWSDGSPRPPIRPTLRRLADKAGADSETKALIQRLVARFEAAERLAQQAYAEVKDETTVTTLQHRVARLEEAVHPGGDGLECPQCGDERGYDTGNDISGDTHHCPDCGHSWTPEPTHHDAPKVHYHQGEDLEPVDRQAIPERIRAVVDAYRDRAAELGAYEIELHHHGGDTFDVVTRHGGDA